MKKINYLMIALIVLVAAGCSHYGALDGDFGKSFTMAKYGQILNPEASKNLKPVTGLNGKAEAEVMKKYTESFSKGSDKGSCQQGITIVPSTGAGQDVYGK